MRAVFFLMAGLAFFSVLMARAPSPSAAQEPKVLTDLRDEEEQRIAKLKAESEPQFTTNSGAVELQRNPDGHFYADVRINGSLVHMLVDTGASAIALSRADARKAGLATSIGMNEVVGEGADGAVHGEYTRLDRVELGPLTAEGLDAVVLNSGEQSLLGQSFLAKFASVQIQGDHMVLR